MIWLCLQVETKEIEVVGSLFWFSVVVVFCESCKAFLCSLSCSHSCWSVLPLCNLYFVTYLPEFEALLILKYFFPEWSVSNNKGSLFLKQFLKKHFYFGTRARECCNDYIFPGKCCSFSGASLASTGGEQAWFPKFQLDLLHSWEGNGEVEVLVCN